MSEHKIAFAGSPIDRADHVRADPEQLASLTNWRARLLHLDGLMPALGDDGRLVWGRHSSGVAYQCEHISI